MGTSLGAWVFTFQEDMTHRKDATMTIEYLGIIALALLTFGAVIAFAISSKAAVETRRNKNTTKSTLAADKSSRGTPADV